MPRRWSRDELVDHRRRAVDQFIERRAQEGTAEYLRHYQDAQELLAGVFKLDNLEAAQRADIAILWEHQLETLIEFVSATR